MPENASWGRRILALIIDWIASYAVVAYALGGLDEVAGNVAANFYIHGLFTLELWLFTALMGGSFGQLVTRLRVVRLDGSRLDPLRALVRSVMIALVIPPLVFRPDGRGLHDMVAGTRVARLD